MMMSIGWILLLSSLHFASSSIVISEFLASNSDGEDWIELHNTGITNVNLSGLYLTDDDQELTKWGFPSIELPADGYLVVYASNDDLTDPNNDLHTNFKLSAGGEYLGLTDGTSAISEYAPEYPPQEQDRSYGMDVNGLIGYFSTPSLGLPNGARDIPVAAPALADQDRGLYNSASLNVNLQSATPEATIRYTTDGSKPTEASTPYETTLAITTTTVLRTVTFRDGYLPSEVTTYSYILLNSVSQQAKEMEGFPTSDMEVEVGGNNFVPFDMQMDPHVVADYAAEMITALTDIPTISLVGSPDDMFGPNGFYFFEEEDEEEDVELEVSIEVLYAGDASEDNEQIHVGAQGHSWNFQKRSIRLNFRSEYGNKVWDTKLFETNPVTGDTATDEFRSIILRGGNNRAWSRVRIPRDIQPKNTAFIEDEFIRATQIAISGDGVGPHGVFVHLYLNGAYWGLYNAVERPDDSFSEAYMDGDEDDWFYINHSDAGQSRDVDKTRWEYLTNTLVHEDLSNAAKYAEIQEYVDVPQFTDYVIFNFWSGNEDWGINNWYSSYRTAASDEGVTPARFWSWDNEYTLEIVDRTGAYVEDFFRAKMGYPDVPVVLWHALFANADFRASFTARVDELTADGGPLSDAVAIERWDGLSNYIRSAVIGESARWGDSLKPIKNFWGSSVYPDTFTRDGSWNSFVNRMRNDVLQGNKETFLSVLTNARMYGSDVRATDFEPNYRCRDEPMCESILLDKLTFGNQVKFDFFGLFCFSWCGSTALFFSALFPCGPCD